MPLIVELDSTLGGAPKKYEGLYESDLKSTLQFDHYYSSAHYALVRTISVSFR